MRIRRTQKAKPLFDTGAAHPEFTYVWPAEKLLKMEKPKRPGMARSIAGYGLDYERVVSRRKAQILLGGRTPPEPGWEIQITAATHVNVPVHLLIRNIKGQLVVFSAFAPADEWEKVFRVSI